MTTVVVLLALLAAGLVTTPSPARAADRPPRIELHSTSVVGPWDIVAGSDGHLWFTNYGGDSIGRMAPDGSVTHFDHPDLRNPRDVALAPNGDVVFNADRAVGRITPAGTITLFADLGILLPSGVAADTDGNIWFAQSSIDSIGRVAPDGTLTTFTDPTLDGAGGLVRGPDGEMWFVHSGNEPVARITTAGDITTYGDPAFTAAGTPTVGPDGNIWFATDTGVAHVSSTGDITSFPTEVGTSLTAGPDGNLWFLDGNTIGRITTAGALLAPFADPALAGARALAAGPDGNVWFVDQLDNRIGHVDPTGQITVHDIAAIKGPGAITVGPDGSAWYIGLPNIGRRSPSGEVTEYDTEMYDATDLVVGPDGNIWFTHRALIGRLDPATGEVTIFRGNAEVYQANAIVVGPDGNLWYTNHSSVGKITTGGAITTYPVDEEGLRDLTVGPDGAIWYTSELNSTIGRITTDGSTTSFTDPEIVAPDRIVAGPDGHLWFTTAAGTGIMRMSTAGEVQYFVDPPIGTPGAIESGPDGDVWFVNDAGVGRVASDGTASIVFEGFGSFGSEMASGPDGSLWLTDPFRSRLGHVTFPASTCEPGGPGPYPDVPPSNPFCADVEWATDHGIATGHTDGTYRPDATVTRGAMAAFLYRAAGQPDGPDPTCTTAPFPDVPTTNPFCGHITWLTDHGIATGHTDGTYRPDATVTRGAMAAFLHRADEVAAG